MYLPIGVGEGVRLTRKQIGFLNGITCEELVGVNRTLMQYRLGDKLWYTNPE